MSRLSRRALISACTITAISGVAPNFPALETSVSAGPPSLMRLFGKAKPIDQADSFILSEEDGPWLLLATHFVGENAKKRAEDTAIEIRSELRLPAFIYKEDFDFTGTAGRDAQSGRSARYANPHHYEAYAVLVGEYDSVHHQSIKKDLERLKSSDLKVFRDPNEVEAEYNTKTPASMVKAFGEQLFKSRKGRGRNPMSKASVTRNPMLPESFFQQPEVDSFVKQLNQGQEHSLLDCPGKFSVVVRTFDGCGTIQGAKNQEKFEPSAERMHRFAMQANKMVLALRKKGEDAYQYHDRTKSVVTIGSFEELGRPLPRGGFQYEPEIRRIMNQYSAMNPQQARSVPGSNKVAANHIAMIPFDVQPKPIAVPRVSKQSIYQAAFLKR